jgi:hypothetical protein
VLPGVRSPADGRHRGRTAGQPGVTPIPDTRPPVTRAGGRPDRAEPTGAHPARGTAAHRRAVAEATAVVVAGPRQGDRHGGDGPGPGRGDPGTTAVTAPLVALTPRGATAARWLSAAPPVPADVALDDDAIGAQRWALLAEERFGGLMIRRSWVRAPPAPPRLTCTFGHHGPLFSLRGR